MASKANMLDNWRPRHSKVRVEKQLRRLERRERRRAAVSALRQYRLQLISGTGASQYGLEPLTAPEKALEVAYGRQ